MDSLLDFEECVKDSPGFRLKLELFETDVTELETHLDKVMKLCGKMVEAGQAYNAANQLFLTSLAELATYHKKDAVITNCLSQFNHGLQEMVSFHTMLFDQTQRAISQQLSNLCTQFLPQLVETRKEFVRIGDDLETAAAKNAQVSRHKAGDAERASHLLLATRKCYQHFALDYCLQLNTFKTQQRIDILNSVFSFVHAQFTFFHQGFDLLRDLEPTMKTMAAQLSQLSTDCTAQRKDLENKHLLVQQRDASGEPMVNPCPGSDDIIQGYLFKRCRRKPKTWKRCWFSIRDNQLIYRKSHKEENTVLFEDLRLCAVKSLDHIDRRFCFELLSVQKCCALQADSEQLKQAWLSALQGSIDLAYREHVDPVCVQPKDLPPLLGGGGGGGGDSSSPGPPTRRPPALGVALRGPGNQRCCDCGEDEPRWASINLGVTMCIECSGIHRSLGVHCSKVRSLTLDSWEPELLKLMCELGNSVINHIYEGSYQEQGLKKPLPSSSRQEKEAWIKAKYVEKKFLKKLGSTEILINGERKSERRWSVKKCRRHNSATTVPKARRRYRQEPGSTSPSTLSAAAAKFRRDSLFCPDELDSLFSYFDTGSGPRSPAGLSSDSGLGGSTDGSTDILVFGSVVDSVTEECEVSEDSSGEAELEAEPETSDPEDIRDLHPGALLYKASKARNLPVMAEALAHGADVNLVNEEDEGKTPLIQAVIGGSLIACEFLLQNAADVNQRDTRGRGPLYHATYLGHTGQVCLFLKRGATQNDGDEDGQDPLSIAVQQANADIVTLLRLARMNEEMRESEGPFGQPGDATYLDIFREFSHMASHNPEKLKRRSVHFRHSFR